ncbi:MAG: D-2-hydroxyacid dehydrogenase [Clostridia bacterium]|jgi:glycerate dehydrogenase|nr:D-2-hydroxyacid dehydrogenase [Clostridia bacterium]MBT7121936.1 D-2-hydroxyacid dehydrogenase [Clostridia bacterium]
MKIVVLDRGALGFDGVSWEPLEALGELVRYKKTSEEQVVERIGDARFVLVNGTWLTRQAIMAAPNLEWIGVTSTGYNRVDVKAASERRIPVCNSPNFSSNSVAELAFALLLELVRGAGEISRKVKSGGRKKGERILENRICLQELFGKTVGIVGYGAIGRRSAAIARGFGMNLIVNDDYIDQSVFADTRFVPLDELFKQSDVIMLHCPLNQDNEHMIDADAIVQMKDGVVIINAARGGLIDEAALANALASGKVGGAGIDSVEVEPIEPDNPLMGAKNIVLTPHIGWSSRESNERLMEVVAETLRSHLNGKTINAVNMPFK